MQRALEIWSGFGMSLTGVHTCGDYMFSGHTVVLTMLNFFVTECEYANSMESFTHCKYPALLVLYQLYSCGMIMTFYAF